MPEKLVKVCQEDYEKADADLLSRAKAYVKDKTNAGEKNKPVKSSQVAAEKIEEGKKIKAVLPRILQYLLSARKRTRKQIKYKCFTRTN